MAADHEFLDGAQVGEQPDILEGARQCRLRHFVRLATGQRRAVERAAPLLGDIEAGQHVEQRGLARAVRADQPVDFARADVEADLRQRPQAAEPLAQAFCLQDDAHAWPPPGLASSRFRTADGHKPAEMYSYTQTIARPNSSMRMPSGSSTTSPNTSRCSGSTTARRNSGRTARMMAPRITPGICPMPPSTTMHSTEIDSVRLKLSGLTKPCMAANSAPATPPNEAPMANASSLMLRVLMPMALAAISSSRIASQARPMREFCRRTQTSTINSVM